MNNKFKDKFEEISYKGFCEIKDFFSKDILNKTYRAIFDLYYIQVNKIKSYNEDLKSLNKEADNKDLIFKNLEFILDLMEKDNKDAAHQVQYFFNESNLIKKIITDDLVNFCSLALNCKESELLFNGPSLFINKPNSKRLLYKWHSESHYYPKRRRFLNIWIPLFTNKNLVNGTMSFKEKSHKKTFPFTQYIGYDKESKNKKNHFIQYEIPNNFLDKYNEHFCINEPGDLIVFHKNLVHKSNLNKSGNYSFALVMRVWTPLDDLTFSGKIGIRPYEEDFFGSPEIIVSSDLD